MDTSDGVMLAFLPTNGDWCRQELPHLTLVYCGVTENLQPSALNSLAKDAISVAHLMGGPFALEVTGIEVFGEEEKVDVLRLFATPKLLTARQLVERWNASQHEFSPHATIGPEGSSAMGEMPRRLYFDRIMVGWGNRELVFRL